ncbi:replication endonuclease [Gallionella capsiferriformans]|uniref:replication endonuclease n=1 Tax=Gallionella capsiferriformans TaxID=370405 RepID=UPI00167F7D6B|nr:replication endonuclease [Gallionella capsiferriformans]
MSKGLENYAKAEGLSWAFLTLTAPPQMHPNPTAGKNTWNGTTPDQAHAWISQAYKNAKERLRKKEIVLSGVRVVEPHQDGCPHWHLLVFAHPTEMQAIEASFRYQPEWKSEQGMKFVLDNGRATASTYLFKYVLKTINSVEKLEGELATVDSWRSTWGIRAFEFIGMPAQGMWRNLRATKECPTEPLVADMWRAANRGDACAFIGLNGGLNIKRRQRPVHTKIETTDNSKTIVFNLTDTGESIRIKSEKWKLTPVLKNTDSTGGAVIPNYPRKANSKPEVCTMKKEISPHWSDIGYISPEKPDDHPVKTYKSATPDDKPYFFNEEVERGWRNKPTGASDSKSKIPNQIDDEAYIFPTVTFTKEEIAELMNAAEQLQRVEFAKHSARH